MKRILCLALIGALLTLSAGYAEQAPASFLYLLQADTFAKTRSQAVEQLAACDRDWIVLDAVFSSTESWSRNDLDAIRSKRPSRKVIAYLSIGEAEDYRPYWRTMWFVNGKLTETAPPWLGASNPAWPGNYQVKYWHPAWQKIICDTIDEIFKAGFDGVYLDIVDGFETFELDGRKYIDNRLNPETKQSFRRDMVDWVKRIAKHARQIKPDAIIIPQNGAQLLEHDDFLAAIDAIGIEDLFTVGDKLQPASHSNYIVAYLKKLTAAQKPVLLIEYPTKAKRQELVRKKAREHGMIWLITDRQLTTPGESGR
jgi:cysteinyl-tRNA synthetase